MRILIERISTAIGDNLMITPLLAYLKKEGNEVYLLTGRKDIFENNPNIDKLIFHEKNSIPNSEIISYFDKVKTAYECDRLIQLTETIEVNLALYPADPRFKYTKPEKLALCNRNYYEEEFRVAGIDGRGEGSDWDIDLRPQLFFTEKEEYWMSKFMKSIKGYKILWGLSGSARNKTYPYFAEVVDSLLKTYKDITVITVGDIPCKILEYPFKDVSRVIKKSGEWSVRESCLATKYADLVISPDTGILHAAGCYETPKIGLLTHTTRENITKYFKNDYSIEAQGVECCPCFSIIYSGNIMCPLDENKSCLCMSKGIPQEKLIARIEEVIHGRKDLS